MLIFYRKRKITDYNSDPFQRFLLKKINKANFFFITGAPDVQTLTIFFHSNEIKISASELDILLTEKLRVIKVWIFLLLISQ